MVELLVRLKVLCLMVKEYNIGLMVDVEEVDCLEMLFDIIEIVFCDLDLVGWDGFGLVV